jgi:hypothetical protein
MAALAGFGPPSATGASWCPQPAAAGSPAAPGPIFGAGPGFGMNAAFGDCGSAAPTPRQQQHVAGVHPLGLPHGQYGKGRLGMDASDGGSAHASHATGRERSSIASGATMDGIFAFGSCGGGSAGAGGSGGGHATPGSASPGDPAGYSQPPATPLPTSHLPAKAPHAASRLARGATFDGPGLARGVSACVGDLLLDPAGSWADDLGDLPPQHMELLEDMLGLE